MSNSYLIEAFRWGAINDHHFVVNVLNNKIKAIRYAEWYHGHRSNIYGIKVTQYNPRYTMSSLVKYIPSKCQEEEPYYNDFKDDLTSIGQAVFYLNEDSLKKLPSIVRKEIKLMKNKKYE